jgi:hypothetical protein
MPKKPPPIEDDTLDDMEDEDPFRDEIIGVEAPSIDLEQVGISRGLAMVLGPEGTRNVIVGAMLRGIGRVLHPDVSDIEGAAEAFATINSAITAIERLTDKQWREVYRRFITRRDDVMSHLLAKEESVISLRGTVSEQRDQIVELENKLAEKQAQVTDPAAFDAIFALFFSGVSRPTRQLNLRGDNDLNVSELLNCVVVTSSHIHFVGRPNWVSSAPATGGNIRLNLEQLITEGRLKDQEVDLASIDGDDEIAVQVEAAKYRRRDGDRGIFLYEDAVHAPRVIAGGYTGSDIKEGESLVVSLDSCPKVLKKCHPEIGIESRLLVAMPAISGKRGIPSGIQFINYGPVSSVFGPYNVTQARVSGPNIK